LSEGIFLKCSRKQNELFLKARFVYEKLKLFLVGLSRCFEQKNLYFLLMDLRNLVEKVLRPISAKFPKGVLKF